MIGEVRHLLSVLRGRIPHRLVCTVSGCQRRDMSTAEWEIFRAHRCLLCPCGGRLLSVHPAFSAPRPQRTTR